VTCLPRPCDYTQFTMDRSGPLIGEDVSARGEGIPATGIAAGGACDRPDGLS
jgi:hypothetical protein